MNADLLEELRTRAEQATQIAKEIELLQQADPRISSRKITFKEFNTLDDVLPRELLCDVLAAGRIVLLQEKEARLELLLGIKPASEPHTGADG